MMYSLWNILVFEKERNYKARQRLFIEEIFSKNLPIFKFIVNNNKIDKHR
jgi:hypothetical protein